MADISMKKRVLIALLSAVIIIIGAILICRALFPLKYKAEIEKYSDKYGVDKYLVVSLIKAESNFDEKAVSHAGAKGLMQLTEETFEYSLSNTALSTEDADIFTPESNIRCGVWYLSTLLKKYDGNITNSVAAYNAGSTNVDKWLSDKSLSANGETLDNIPFGETLRHTKKISKYMAIYKILYPKW
ncbi:MAG: lytic transglycosylase domain-containing protein [Clostridia bacterium]|nr:lytic transglycosylase domain-containing protein [Clostridia bacterium]